MNKKTIITILLALVAMVGQAQTTDTIAIGMELRVQDFIGTSKFMYKCEIPAGGFKGLPADTTSFRLYAQKDLVCILARDGEQKDIYYCAFDMNKERDFSNDYRYYFTRKQIADARTFTPQRYADIWIAPEIRLNGVAGRGGMVTSLLAFDEFVPMLHIHDFFVGKFVYQDKNYYICSAYDKKELAVIDTIPINNNDLARELLRSKLLREIQFPILHDGLVIRLLDMDFSRQQCRISVTPLTEATLPTFPYEGFRAPAISTKDIKGKAVKLGNSYTLLDFWGTWCKPCISIIPELVDIHKLYPALNLVSVAVEGSMNDLPKLKKLTKELNMDWTHVCQLRSDTTSIASSFNISAFPTTIIIDPIGRIVFRSSGSNSTDKLKSKLKEIYPDNK